MESIPTHALGAAPTSKIASEPETEPQKGIDCTAEPETPSLGELTLQDAVARLEIPETTIHRWIAELKLQKRIQREGRRTVCYLPAITIARLAEHKARRRVQSAPEAEPIAAPGEEPHAKGCVSTPDPSEPQTAQMVIALAPEHTADQPRRSLSHAIVIIIVKVVRIAGAIAYCVYWITVRVFAPREISRRLLKLNKSDYIGWADEPEEVGVPTHRAAMTMRPSKLTRSRKS